MSQACAVWWEKMADKTITVLAVMESPAWGGGVQTSTQAVIMRGVKCYVGRRVY